MQVGLMTTAPLREWGGKTLDLDGYCALIREWGGETLDIFPQFLADTTAEAVRGALDRNGMSCACFYVAADLCATGDAAEAEARAEFTTGLEAAKALGSPIVFTYGTQHTYAGEEMFQRYADRLGEMLPLFAGTGITLVVENAGTLMHKVEDMLRLDAMLGDAGLRLCLDTGNFYLWEQDEVRALELAKDPTIHFHVKDYVDRHWLGEGEPGATDVYLGTGAVRHAEVLAILGDLGYGGTLALEPHSEAAIEVGLKTLAGWVK